MVVPTFVDLQGFLVGGQFVVKEFAALRKRTVLSHYIFASPIPWHFLASADNDAVVYVKGHEKRQWLWNLLLDDERKAVLEVCKQIRKRKNNHCRKKEKLTPISVERLAVRLLSRRYTLTTTGYKFLEIGINVNPPSYMDIAVGDRGQKLILSLETWKGLYEQRWNIYKLLQNDYKNNFVSVGQLTVRVCLMNDVTFVLNL
ncbi:hypothetical protein P5V15_004362 [Pogonomyrmex californicus]